LQRVTGQAPSPPAEFSLDLDTAPFKGNKDAKIILVEFSDYQCPFCSRHFRETLPEIEKEYLTTGKLKYIFWDFPLQSIHRDALKAHEAAYCAGEQGKYWEMHDRLFVNQDALAVPDLAKHAIAVDLDLARFQSCLNSEKHAARIRVAIADAQKIGVTATPTFFVVDRSSAGQSPKILRIIRGAQSYAQFRDALEKALAE
jgi:protein-disulfide isomerase